MNSARQRLTISAAIASACLLMFGLCALAFEKHHDRAIEKEHPRAHAPCAERTWRAP